MASLPGDDGRRYPEDGSVGHVVHVTTVHRPHDPRIFRKEARALRGAGWKVTIIAPADRDHTVDGIRVLRIQPERDRARRMTVGVLRALRLARRQRADIVHLHDPELLPLGIVLRPGRRAVVYDAHEDLPSQVAAKPWIARRLEPIAAAGSAVLLRLATIAVDGIVAATAKVAERYPPHKTVIVHNYPDLDKRKRPVGDYALRSPSVVYVGGLSESRGLRQMIEGVSSVPAELGATLHLAGRFQPESLEVTARRYGGAERVVWHGWLAGAELSELLDTARIGLCVLQPLSSYVESLPTKLFEYMAAGLPVVASDFPAWRRIVEGAECGLLIDPTDPSAIADAVASLLAEPDRAHAMGEAGRRAVLERYSWAPEADRLVEFYARLMAGRRATDVDRLPR